MYAKENYLRQLVARMAFGEVPLGSNIIGYVRSSGQRPSDSDEIKAKFYTSLATALAQTTTGVNDVIFVLPGHNEVVGTTLLTNLLPNTYIVGIGSPDASDAPRFTWAAQASNMALDVANCLFANLRFYADADAITKAITVTGAGNSFVNCRWDTGVASAKDMAIAVSLETGADRTAFIDCNFLGSTGTSQMISKPASNNIDELLITGCHFAGVTSAAGVGLVDIAGATTALALNVFIHHNVFEQRTGSGTVALTISDIAHTGYVFDNRFAVVANSSTLPAATGITLAGTSAVLIHFAENYGSDGALGTSGILTPAVTS